MASNARNFLSQKRIVEMTVKASKHEVAEPITYLDSEVDYKDPKCLAVVIADSARAAFKEQKIDDPSSFYRYKRIRVTGRIVFDGNQYQIHVTSPKQIQVIESR